MPGFRFGFGISTSPNEPKRRPLDALAASLYAAFGLRRMVSSWTGPLVTVRRSSDNATLDISAGADDWLDTAALLAFTGAASGYVTRLWDQSGLGRHAVQVTASAQPRIVNAGVLDTLNGRPTIVNNASTYLVVTNSIGYTNAAPGVTMGAIASIDGTTANGSSIIVHSPIASSTAARASLSMLTSGLLPAIAGRNPDGSTAAVLSGAGLTLPAMRRFIGRIRASEGMFDLSIDGAAMSAVFQTAGNFPAVNQYAETRIGMSPDGYNPLLGRISAIALFAQSVDLTTLDAGLQRVFA